MKARSLLAADAAALGAFDRVVKVRDPTEMDARSRVSGRLFGESALCTYALRDQSLLRTRFVDPIAIFAVRRLGSIMICLSASRFETETDIGGQGIDSYCLTMMLEGTACLIQGNSETVSACSDGAAHRLSAGTRTLWSDNALRRHLWISADALEDVLEGVLGERLRRPLEFKPSIDWSRGLAASLRSELDFLTCEMTRQDGVADNPVALASFTDLIFSLVLRGIPHNHLECLGTGRPSAVPAYVRRAEEFMRANAAMPIRMEQVAVAAGCSVRTLGAVFHRFRDTTPLAALHMIRLDQVQAELSRGAVNGSTTGVARRYGFTNPSRFAIAYGCRFGETPRDTVRRSQR